MENFDNCSIAIKNYLDALQALYDQDVLLNKQSFTAQIGEWLVSTIYDGERAKSNIQKGWDILADGKYIQVKTHSTSSTNPAQYSSVERLSTEHIDELIIVVFSETYKLKHFYKVPWSVVSTLIIERTKKQKGELNWSAIKEYIVPINHLPKQEIVALFR